MKNHEVVGACDLDSWRKDGQDLVTRFSSCHNRIVSLIPAVLFQVRYNSQRCFALPSPFLTGAHQARSSGVLVNNPILRIK